MFKEVSETKITGAIMGEFFSWFEEYLGSDVIIVGGGPSGLVAGMELSKKGYKTLLIESNNYLGGGFWIGGYLMNTLTFREPSQEMLKELDIRHKKATEGLYTASGPEACSKLISRACDAGLRILNMTKVDDVVFRKNRVNGVVLNWTPVGALPRAITCVDPVALEAKVVIDATGHDAVVCRCLEKRGLLDIKGFGPMDVRGSEDLIVERTGEVIPGLIASGMAVSTVYGIPRMGPTFGSMLFSGSKAADIAVDILMKEQGKKGAERSREAIGA